MSSRIAMGLSCTVYAVQESRSSGCLGETRSMTKSSDYKSWLEVGKNVQVKKSCLWQQFAIPV